MEYTWRWYGPADPVTLNDIRQAGATGIVTALHNIAPGKVWTNEAITERKKLIEDSSHRSSLRWSVVESVPVTEAIKIGSEHRDRDIAVFQECIHNLGANDIRTVCYNFMPVLDWTRTDLDYLQSDGSTALRFDQTAFAAFDLYILQRPGAEKEYSEEEKQQAKQYAAQLDEQQAQQLQQNIIAGLPGSDKDYSLQEFQEVLNQYQSVDDKQLRNNLQYFLEKVIPVAEDAQVNMAIHPDDPPRPLLGLPRVVSTETDAQHLLEMVDSPNNGLTFCTGSYGARPDNDLPGMIERLGARIHFLHFRSVQREGSNVNGSFYEANHLEGSADLVNVVKATVALEKKQRANGMNHPIPMRPDHGHKMLDDLHKKTNPGYSAIGRLRGLAELRGVEAALKGSFNI
ncbi:mannonate dehydratase [Tunicatimonas pelagia]|uniref:mannonate dehydratase n=1 Tax=Tunicatimonas pelagia TaxID=931531 RepID=UPI00266541DB|nr:mannonate dehydratase [Tunicatimonas pelagia]WKN42914.1 mannonate dehydratase [Tunicatimonas pelagia]